MEVLPHVLKVYNPPQEPIFSLFGVGLNSVPRVM